MSKNKKFEQDKLIELLEDLNPVLDQKGLNLIINCPSCGQRECSVSLDESHLWGCFRLKKCGERGNIWKLLKLIGKLESKFFNSKDNTDFINLSNLFSTSPIEYELQVTNEEIPDIPEPFGWRRVFEDEYLNSRGFKSYEYCEVGRVDFEPKLKKNYVVFLVKQEGKIKGYVGRHVWDKKKIEDYNKQTGKNKIKRYVNSTGTPFGKLLYGYDEINDKVNLPVCLVEGIFDKHAVDEKLMLHNNRFMYCCATFKAAISDDQIVKLLVKGVKDIILFYDPDVIRIIQRNVIKLTKYFNVEVILSNNGKDPDEMSQEEVIEQFTNNCFKPQKVLTDFMQINFQ